MGTGKESRNYTKIRPVSLIICLCGRVGRFGMGLTSIDSASWLSSTRVIFGYGSFVNAGCAVGMKIAGHV